MSYLDLAKKVAARHSRHKNAGVLEDSVLAAFRSGEVTSGPVVKSFEITSQGIVAHVEASVLLPETKETMKAALPHLPPAQVAKIVSTSPDLLAGMSPEMLGQMSFKTFPDATFVTLVEKVIRSGLSKYSSELLMALLEGREAYVLHPSELQWEPSSSAQWSSHVSSLVSGGTPVVDAAHGGLQIDFSVQNGVAHLVWFVYAAWENPRGLKILSTFEHAEVHLSRKVYPTADSVRTQFGESEIISTSNSRYWVCRVDQPPKGSPGILRVTTTVDNALTEAVPLTALSRAQLEGLVVALTENW